MVNHTSKPDLDSFVSSYTPDFKYNLDNELMLNYYPSRIIPKLNEGNLLELGLGHGHTVKRFMGSCSDYTILEGSHEVIENFKVQYPDLSQRINVVHTYFESFETPIKFSNIIMGFILEHVENPEFIIQKYIELLKENGKLFIAVPNGESLHRRFGYHAGILANFDYLSEYDKQLGHLRYFTKNKLIELAEKNRLRINSMEGIFLKPITSNQIAQLELSNEILAAMLVVGRDYPELCNAILIELSHE